MTTNRIENVPLTWDDPRSDRPRHLRKRGVLELRDIDKPVQHTYGSADVQTATGGTR